MLSRSRAAFVALVSWLFFAAGMGGPDKAFAESLELEIGDHICFVGNALGERMQHQNYFETLLHQNFPEHRLTIRNLCVPADEPATRLRSLNFGSPDEHLAHSSADVIFFFFGYNESFRLKPGLDPQKVLADFRDELSGVVRHTLKQTYNGQSPPRVVLVTPISFEETGNPHLPEADDRVPALAKITEQIERVGDELGVPVANVFRPTGGLFITAAERFTLDGGHLNDAGYRVFAPILYEAVFGQSPPRVEYPAELRDAIADKNFHWFNRYRAVNGYSIYGKRGTAGFDGTYRNRDVMNRELEILDEMTAIRDQRIWAIAAGKSVPDEIDDSGTLPFITPKTNVGGPDDRNAKRGKLGSLDYLTAAEQQRTFELADGYQIQLVASEEQFPELANPVALDFDARGRLWVSTMPSYPHWKPKQPMDDKLLIFEDQNGDGAADECKVFAGGLHQPTGFAIGDGGVYVGNQQDILFLKDTDGDDRADFRQRTLVGFDTADSHHGLAAFEWGPGGHLYFQEGTFKFSQLETPYGPTRLIEGGTWRFHPRSRRFDVHINFAYSNPWGYGYDYWGQEFIGDASPGFGYWGAPISGRLDYPLKHPGGSQHRRVAKEQGYDDADGRYPTFYPKRIRPLAGCVLLSSGHFPEEMQNNFLVTNVIGDRAVLRHSIREQESGFVGREEPMLVNGGDGNFRPVDVEVAPDGSLYIVDWHNALIGHLQHNLRDPNRDKSHGRIWRITHASRPLVDSPVLADLSAGELFDYLVSDQAAQNQRHAYRARQEFSTRPTKEVLSAVRSRFIHRNSEDNGEKLSNHDMLEALWAHQSHDVVAEWLLDEVLQSENPRARAAAVRVLSYWADRLSDPVAKLQQMILDPHPRVRLETVRATTWMFGNERFLDQQDELIRTALQVLDSPTDEYLQYVLDEAMRRFEQVVLERAPYHFASHKQTSEVSADKHAHHAKADHNELDHAGMDHTAMHHGGADNGMANHQPTLPVFLDMSPKVVSYQLARLDTSELISLTEAAEAKQLVPVYQAILARGDTADRDREAALDSLIKQTGDDAASVLLDLIEQVAGAASGSNADERERAVEAIEGLTRMLVALPESQLKSHRDRLAEMANRAEKTRAKRRSTQQATATAAMAALITADESELANEWAAASTAGRLAWLAALPMVKQESRRVAQRPMVVDVLTRSDDAAVTSAALTALSHLPTEWEESFALAAKRVAKPAVRPAAVKAMLKVPRQALLPAISRRVAEELVAIAESTPAAKRTSESFIDSMQLVDRLLPKVPRPLARQLRNRLREITVRVIRIRTVAEEMRYDTTHFAVEAGRPVQIVLENPDAMPHNFVVTQPGSLKEVAALGLQAGPGGGTEGKAYVPDSPLVLHSTDPAPTDGKVTLTFTAPSQPGEYPYVCTFPQHWYRMYGVMVVVDDLEAYQADPTPPADPIGNNRSFVKAWTVEDFDQDLSQALRGRSAEIGERLFTEATCASCHQVDGQGGIVGPPLDSVLTKWKGDTRELLREILHPSERIDDRYAMHLVLTVDGQTVTGILVKETDDEVQLIANAQADKPTVIPQDDIEEMVRTKVSMMPKALLDQFTKDEILELLAYVTSVGDNPMPSSDARK